MELFLTLVVGLFILLGTGFAFIFKNDKKFIDFSTSLGFGVMISLILCCVRRRQGRRRYPF